MSLRRASHALFTLLTVALLLWTVFCLWFALDTYQYCREYDTLACPDYKGLSLIGGGITAVAWGIWAVIRWLAWLIKRKKARLIVATLVACLLFALSAYRYFWWNYLREIENSNWSMQGEWIAFHCVPTGLNARGSLYLVRPDGSELIRLTTGIESASSPSWSPTGDEIVFESPRGELAILKRGSNALTRLPITNQPYSAEYSPAWLPDGQWIAFISSSWKDGTDTLFRVSADGSVLEPVLEGVSVAPITWTSDGQWIIYYESYWSARKVRVDGSEAQDYVEYDNEITQLVASLPWGGLDPVWSPDRQWIVFKYSGISINDQLFRIKPDGSELQQLTDLNCSVGDPDWIKMPGISSDQ